MAYQSCAADLAKNIAIDCEKPIVGGYTGRAVLVQYKDAPVFVTDASNPRKVKAITLGEGVKTIAIDNIFADPFTGSSTSSSADAGRVTYTKTLAVRIPLRGGDVSKDIVEPLSTSALGFLIIAEKKDKTDDGAFEIIGSQNALKANADGITRTESENGGDITATMSCAESWFERTLIGADGDYASALEAFEELLAKAI